MTRTLTATEARVRFGQLLRQVTEDGDTVIVERSGKPQAVVLPLAEYEALVEHRQQSQRWPELLDEAIALADRDLAGRTFPPVDEVIRSMREERDAQLLRLR